MPNCSSIQKSLAWCQGKPELPGVKRRIYYISKYEILQWPTLQHDENGRLLSASYSGNFVLRADSKWKFIDILPDKSQLTSDPQGEYPSQTQLNKLVAVHPGVDAAASEASAYLNNNDNVFLVEDMRGAMRVVGSDKWPTKTTVNQDLGQGPTGTTSTTINAEATDECPAPFYTGSIATDDGTISASSGSSSGSGSSSSGSGSSSSGSSSSGSSSTGELTNYNSTVKINGTNYNIPSDKCLDVEGPLTSLQFTGSNMQYIGIEVEGEGETPATISADGTSASWSGRVLAPYAVNITYGNKQGWFSIIVRDSSGTGSNTSTTDENVSISFSNGAAYNKNVLINGQKTVVTEDDTAYSYGTLSSIKITGRNMTSIRMYLLNSNTSYPFTVSSDGTSAEWTGSLSEELKYVVKVPNGSSPGEVEWFKIDIRPESSAGEN